MTTHKHQLVLMMEPSSCQCVMTEGNITWNMLRWEHIYPWYVHQEIGNLTIHNLKEGFRNVEASLILWFYFQVCEYIYILTSSFLLVIKVNLPYQCIGQIEESKGPKDNWSSPSELDKGSWYVTQHHTPTHPELSQAGSLKQTHLVRNKMGLL